MGARKDEGNPALWQDIYWDNDEILVRGSKTEESWARQPLPPPMKEALFDLYQARQDHGELIFPGRKNKTEGKQVYDKRRLLQKIQRLTASCKDCSAVDMMIRKICNQCGAGLWRDRAD